MDMQNVWSRKRRDFLHHLRGKTAVTDSSGEKKAVTGETAVTGKTAATGKTEIKFRGWFQTLNMQTVKAHIDKKCLHTKLVAGTDVLSQWEKTPTEINAPQDLNSARGAWEDRHDIRGNEEQKRSAAPSHE